MILPQQWPIAAAVTVQQWTFQELQADAHLAINHMLSVRRSSELERQQAIWDYEASLHQQEAKTAAANERAKIAHSRKGLQARVKCTKAVMRAKYNYRVAVQEARAAQCNKLKEAETAYSEALHENTATCSHSTVQHFAQGTCKVHEQAGRTGPGGRD